MVSFVIGVLKHDFHVGKMPDYVIELGKRGLSVDTTPI